MPHARAKNLHTTQGVIAWLSAAQLAQQHLLPLPLLYLEEVRANVFHSFLQWR
jgi:hypothetical protein